MSNYDAYDAETGEGLSEPDLLGRYDDMLDEIYGEVDVCGVSYSASRTLKEVDPTAYRCGYVDWLGTEIQDGVLWEERWTIGNNQPGCLPDSDPTSYGSWSDAWEALQSDMREWADEDDQGHDDEDETGSTLATVEAMLADENPLPNMDVCITLTTNNDWPRVFWLTSEGE